jgi:hypothetical protein
MSHTMDKDMIQRSRDSAEWKRPILIGAGVMAICAAVYFSYQAAPPSAASVSGTINAPSAAEPADPGAVTHLKDAAAALESSAREFSARGGDEGALAGELDRAAAELAMTAQAAVEGRIALAKSTAAALERQAAELNNAVHHAEGVSLEHSAAADARKNAAALARAAVAARSATEGQTSAR